jgi:hypothetical protein
MAPRVATIEVANTLLAFLLVLLIFGAAGLIAAAPASAVQSMLG